MSRSSWTARCQDRRDSRVAAFFHTFGSTVTLWYPLIEGVTHRYVPNPLDAAKCAALIDRYKLTFLLLTPPFCAYIGKAEPEQLNICAHHHRRRNCRSILLAI